MDPETEARLRRVLREVLSDRETDRVLRRLRSDLDLDRAATRAEDVSGGALDDVTARAVHRARRRLG
jgi:hypothetical protein